MLNVLIHKGNESQTYTEIPAHHSLNGNQIKQTTNIGKYMVWGVG
jgi:hypothetical protein